MRMSIFIAVGLLLQQLSIAGEYVSFKTTDHRYLVAENGGGGVVNANRVEIGAWERFYVVHLTGDNFSDGARVCIQAASGHYLSADNFNIVADRQRCAAWEEFEVRRRGNYISFKTHQNRYIAAHDGWVKADRIEANTWEKFLVEKE